MELGFRNRDEWRTWLEENSHRIDGIWMINYKKHTGIGSVSYDEAVEEAICFGWIDGKIKRANDDYFIRLFTPRRKGSRWSKINIDRARKMIEEGKMKKEGLDAYGQIIKNPGLAYDNQRKDVPEIPDELLEALKASKTGFENFMKFPPSAKRLYIEWYKYAKQDKTKTARAAKIVRFSEINQKPGMF